VKVLAIRGRNLASLAGHFDIDLEQGALRNAGLYAITGPVGAGKSTLLDALCLALYDRTPRLGHGGVRIGRAGEDDDMRLRDRDVRTILRRGTAAGFAEVDFIGRGGVAYRARWSVRHAYGRADGRIQKQTLQLQEIDSGKVIGANKTEVLAAIQECVGLSFEQFCRSVLLAQGDFAAFLKASAKDRAALLERMTGSELYGQLSIAAHERAREHAADLKLLCEQRCGLTPLDDDIRKQLERDREQREQALVQCRTQLEAAAAACAWHQQEQRLQHEMVQAREQVSAAKAAQQEAATAQTEGAARFEAETQRMCAELQATLDDLAERQAAAAAWLEEHTGLAHLAREWPRWQSLLARYLEGAATLVGLDEARLALEDRLQELRARHGEAEVAKASFYEALQDAEAARAVAVHELAAAAPETWRERRKVVEHERFLLQKVDGRFAATKTAQGEADRVRQRLARARFVQDKARGLVETAGARLGPLKVRLAEADRAWQRAQQVLSLADRRQTLVAGEPCPLCGATEHPCHQADSPHGLIQAGLDDRVQELREEVSLVEKQITAAQTDLQNQLRSEEEAGAELLAHEQTAAMLQADIERTVAEMAAEVREHAQDSERLQARLATLAADLDEVQARENAAAALEKAKQAADTTVENQRHQWLAAVDILRSAEQQLRRDEGELLAANSRCEQLRTNQNGIVAELREVMSWCGDGWEQTLQRDPPGFVTDCGRRAEEYRSQEASAQQLARGLASAGPVLTQLHGLLGGGLAAPRIDAARLQAVAAVLAECAITGDAKALVSELQQAVSAEARRRQDEAERLAMAEQRCREADTIVAERSRVHDEHQQNRPADQDATAARAAKDQADQACQAAQAQCEEARVKLELDDRERQAVAELEPRIASQEEACRVWQALDDLIGSRDGARFRVFAQSLTLDVLLQTANRHLAELAPRYQLMRVPGHDLDLQVVDLDMAEEIRSVHSLSGGETFLVSLALALALASLSAHETPVESLFIDEGLGTLDTQTLDIALSTLDALQASGRKVGLISHVAGTAERIGVQVRVSPIGGGRSRVDVQGTVT
jgi:exonuclease SbcC